MLKNQNPRHFKRDADLECFINSFGGITLRQEDPMGVDDLVILEPQQVIAVYNWLQHYLNEHDTGDVKATG